MPQPQELPRLEVDLIGQDGNAFFIIGRCLKIMRQNDYPVDVIKTFEDEAMSGDYDHLLATVMDWFDVM